MHTRGVWRMGGFLDGGDRRRKGALMGFAIDAVNMTVLAAHRDHGVAFAVPVQHRGRADIEIQTIVGRHLMPPFERTGARV